MNSHRPIRGLRRAPRPATPVSFRLRPGLALALAPWLTGLAPWLPAARAAEPALPPVVVTGNPLGRDLATPGTVLGGDGLSLRRAGTLGETLDGLPGVAGTWFGPGSNRPVIRGQDGDRIRVLANGGAALDASALSGDHALPVEPLLVERIEVLRGPAALAFGGSAGGGVVNVIDARVPRRHAAGTQGEAEFRVGGAAAERAGAFRLDHGTGDGATGWVLHADAAWRRTGDLRVPAFERPLEEGGSERRRRVVNSDGSGQAGALGLGWVGTDARWGLAVDSDRREYGVVVEEGVRIDMRRDRLQTAGEWRAADGLLRRVSLQASVSDYEHRELEDGAVGTVFRTRGGDLRVDAVHRPLSVGDWRLDGSWGLQAERSRFEALGDEAFVPSTRTRQIALFASEDLTVSPQWRLQAGLRAERVRVSSDGDAAGTTEPRFGDPRQRDFSPRGAVLAAVWQPAVAWQAALQWSSTQRAPTHYELYAEGVHVATGAYERGDPAQALERGRQWDARLQWRDGDRQASFAWFRARYANYIALAGTGTPVDDGEGGSLPLMVFEGVAARLQGWEAEWRDRLPWGPAGSAPTWSLAVDQVRGDDLDRGTALPRLAPRRWRAGLAQEAGDWGWRLELIRHEAQTRVPADDTATPGSTRVNLAMTRRLPAWGQGALWFVKLDNATDALALSATSLPGARALAPLPGRSLATGLRVRF